MRFRLITDEKEFAKLFQMRQKRMQADEANNIEASREIISKMVATLDVKDANTFKEARNLINDCLGISANKLWLKEIGAEMGRKVKHIESQRVATVVEITEKAGVSVSFKLNFEDGQTKTVEWYKIQAVKENVDYETFRKRIQGETL